MHAISSYHGNRPTHPPTNTARCKQTGPTTIHCAAASTQCNQVTANVSTQWRNVSHRARREYRMLSMSTTVLFDKPACESSRLLCGAFCMCLDHSYVEFTVWYRRWCTGSFLMFITTVIVAYMAYTRVVCASMHVLFLVRKFLLCTITFVPPGKQWVVLKIAYQSHAGSHLTHKIPTRSFATRILPVP